MSPQGPVHFALVQRLTKALYAPLTDRATVISQSPVALLDDEPEPDVAVIPLAADFYESGLPSAPHLVIEVRGWARGCAAGAGIRGREGGVGEGAARREVAAECVATKCAGAWFGLSTPRNQPGISRHASRHSAKTKPGPWMRGVVSDQCTELHRDRSCALSRRQGLAHEREQSRPTVARPHPKELSPYRPPEHLGEQGGTALPTCFTAAMRSPVIFTSSGNQ